MIKINWILLTIILLSSCNLNDSKDSANQARQKDEKSSSRKETDSWYTNNKLEVLVVSKKKAYEFSQRHNFILPPIDSVDINFFAIIKNPNVNAIVLNTHENYVLRSHLKGMFASDRYSRGTFDDFSKYDGTRIIAPNDTSIFMLGWSNYTNCDSFTFFIPYHYENSDSMIYSEFEKVHAIRE